MKVIELVPKKVANEIQNYFKNSNTYKFLLEDRNDIQITETEDYSRYVVPKQGGIVIQPCKNDNYIINIKTYDGLYFWATQ